jgi:RimJ/RimL family protein N-acetyltransferase
VDTPLFQGELVRLTVVDPEKDAEAFSRWSRDSEYWRLLASDPAIMHSPQKSKEWLEKILKEEEQNLFMFMIRRLEDDRLIGEVGLDGVQWNHGDTFIGIGLGEREFWGKGYGTDAMRVILRYAFTELNLHRVSLNVLEYNTRALRSYEKVGFKVEGRAREFLSREGKRWDLIFMGILREEWEKQQ